MEDLKGKTAKIRVDYLAGKGLSQGDLVEILDQWEEHVSPDNPSLGKRTKIMVRSWKNPTIVEEIDLADVVMVG